MSKIELSLGQREAFKEALKDFIARVDKCVEIGTTKGSEPKELKQKFNDILGAIGYQAACDFGSGNLKKNPCVVFARDDMLGKDLVNGESLAASRGIYIVFGYKYDEQESPFYILLGNSDSNDASCKALEKINQNDDRYETSYANFEDNKDEIIDNILKIMNYLNEFNVTDFTANNITESENSDEFSNNKSEKIPLNQILYGPPGTGKTYHTIDKALEILNLSEYKQGTLDTLKKYGITDSNPSDRKSQKAIFDIFTKNERDEQIGQIAFVTFHQSFSYEEFVEGIKPQGIKSNADNEDSIESSENIESQNIKTKEDSKDININLKTADSNTITYEIKPGIFKQICQRALQNMQIDNYKKIAQKEHAESVNLDFTKTLWRLYTIPGGDSSRDYFDECVENDYVWAYSGYKAFGEQVASGDYIVIPIATHGRSHTIRGFGIIGDIIKNQDDKIYRSIKWLWIDKSGSGLSLDINFGRPTIQRAKGTNKTNVLNAISEILNTDSIESKSVLKPYILIIDEINRGNISKILGELITLIEPSKRIGKDEELKVTLPYSNEPFGVPQNLYIIGTMNTADRSIALIDTALRRRFSFTEMMPDSKHLADIRLKDAQDLSLNELLDSINNRIEFLLDREHTIGHAFFIGLDSINALKEAFQHKIIPLLQEYFYDDYAKINAVLNDNGMIKSFDMETLKVNLSEDFVDSDKRVYRITKPSEWNTDTFKKIYNSKDSTDSTDSKDSKEQQ